MHVCDNRRQMGVHYIVSYWTWSQYMVEQKKLCKILNTLNEIVWRKNASRMWRKQQIGPPHGGLHIKFVGTQVEVFDEVCCAM